MSNKRKISKNKIVITTDFYYLLFIFFILVLTLINTHTYFYPKNNKVLGIETQNNDSVYWYKFLKEHPGYIPGWLEIGRTDKVKVIDPNYF